MFQSAAAEQAKACEKANEKQTAELPARYGQTHSQPAAETLAQPRLKGHKHVVFCQSSWPHSCL